MEKYQKEFFSKPVTVMIDERKAKNGSDLVKKLNNIGFSDIETISCVSGFGEPSIIIYHKGDTIHGTRINHFLEYAARFANAA